MTDMLCVRCRRMLKKKIRWFSYGQRFYFAWPFARSMVL